MTFPETISLSQKNIQKIEEWYKTEAMVNYENARIADFFTDCVKHHTLKLRKLRYILLQFLGKDVDTFVTKLLSFIDNLPAMTPEEKEREREHVKEKKKSTTSVSSV